MHNFQAEKNINQGFYKSFQPHLTHKNWQVLDTQILALLSKADRHIGRLDMYSEYVNLDLYVSMLSQKRQRNHLKSKAPKPIWKMPF